MEQTTYVIDSLGLDHMDSTINVIEFDQKGYATCYINKTPSGKLTMNETMSHYPNYAVKEFNNTIDGKQISRLALEIDTNGHYWAAKTYDSSGNQDSYYTGIAENEYGIVYRAKQHFMNGKLESAFDMKCDKAIIVESTYTDSTGKLTYRVESKLNAGNDPVEQITTTMVNGSPKIDTETYKYDQYDRQNNWVQRTSFDNKGRPVKMEKRSLRYY